MSKKALLVLEDGTVYEGNSFGAEATTYGEVVFDTAMAGYQEMLTDPSFAGQIVMPTYPLVGNYGINGIDSESKQIQVRGFVVREYCQMPSHWQSTGSLHEYLKANSIPGLSGIDTRALTRRLRSAGVMMGILTSEMTTEEALKELRSLPHYDTIDFIKEVSTEELYKGEDRLITEGMFAALSGYKGTPVRHTKDFQSIYNIVAIDCGLKYNILRILYSLDCSVTIVPCTTSADEILKMNPDGIILSPGPGDPALLDYIIKTVKELLRKKPIMGICLGHQLIAHAFGARTFKLKFGHRGGNHPVRDLATGRIHITTQNHGYAVDENSVKNGLEVSHINSNDGTIEGLCHKELPILSIQYHSEGAPGPQDNVYLFNRFLEMIKEIRN